MEVSPFNHQKRLISWECRVRSCQPVTNEAWFLICLPLRAIFYGAGHMQPTNE